MHFSVFCLPQEYSENSLQLASHKIISPNFLVLIQALPPDFEK